MRRIPINPRPNWEQKILDQGFLFYKDDSYYNESAVYEFTSHEVAVIEQATAEIYAMCLQVADYVIKNKLWSEFFIPEQYAALIEWSWNTRQPSLYGRFDLAFNNGKIKLLEFNADTPTLLLESSAIQWYWLQDHDERLDQFNTIHDILLAHLTACKSELLPGKLFFTCNNNMEDFVTTKYLQDVATQAGIDTEFIYIDDIGLDENDCFIDDNGNKINNIFKLYPYEWLFDEPFGEYLVKNKENCLWIEPAYKAILSNKMMLKYIYELFPDSPYILPCVVAKDIDTTSLPLSYAKKPIFSREGENVSLVIDGKIIEETDGEYGEEGYVYQQYFELPEFDGKHPILGSWVIGGKPAGFGIRESAGRITNVTSSFCSHYIAGEEK